MTDEPGEPANASADAHADASADAHADASAGGKVDASSNPELPSAARRVFASIGRGAAIAGAAAARAVVSAGRAVGRGYDAVDPDVRRHVAQLPVLGLTLLAPDGAEIRRLPDDGHRAIVFVHGLGGRASNFFPMTTWLKAHGRRRIYAIALAQHEALDAMAVRLRACIDEIVKVNEMHETAGVDIVAHSMGGLVARLAVEDPVTARRVANVVTLGTPHAGTHAARFAATTHTLALRPDSSVIERLRAQLPWTRDAGRPALVSLWSKADMLLLPPETACVDGATNIEMQGFTHYSYLIHPSSWRTVQRAIA